MRAFKPFANAQLMGVIMDSMLSMIEKMRSEPDYSYEWNGFSEAYAYRIGPYVIQFVSFKDYYGRELHNGEEVWIGSDACMHLIDCEFPLSSDFPEGEEIGNIGGVLDIPRIDELYKAIAEYSKLMMDNVRCNSNCFGFLKAGDSFGIAKAKAAAWR